MAEIPSPYCHPQHLHHHLETALGDRGVGLAIPASEESQPMEDNSSLPMEMVKSIAKVHVIKTCCHCQLYYSKVAMICLSKNLKDR